MDDNFFEGNTYSGDFKGLEPKYYPLKYKQYITEEVSLLKSKVKDSNKILEAGVGIGRLIPELAPIVKEFVGVDNSKFMLEKSTKIAKSFNNVKIIKGDIENLSKLFPEKQFDYSLCVWNTLGNLTDPVKALKELKQVTSKSIFITTFYKNTVKDRLEFYKAVDVSIERFDEESETFYLKGYSSKTFDEKILNSLAEAAGLKLKETKILGGVIIWAEMSS